MLWNRTLCRCGQTNTQAESRFRRYVKRVDTTVTAHVSYAWRGCVFVVWRGVCVCLLWWVCFLWCLFMWRRNECVSLEGVVFMACLCLDGTLRFLLCVCVLDLDGYWQHAESWHTAVLSSTHSPVWPFKCILTLCWRCPMRLRMTAHTQIQTKTDADTHTAQIVWSQTETLGWSDRA